MLSTKKYRIEIQFLRCVAICAVLGFHLFPKYVHQGYLGVDVFFVLSGYLMTMILKFSASKKLTVAITLDFYRRRFKRLMPAYLSTTLMTIVLGAIILIRLDYELLQQEGLLAVVFGTNFEGFMKHQDYFQLVATNKFLLHTWSLSVEVQYYLVAPFLLAWIAGTRHPIYTTAILSFTSWSFQTRFMVDESWSFYSTPARLWQFLLGTLVYYVEQKHGATSTNATTIKSKVMMPSEPIASIDKQHISSGNQVISGVLLIIVCFMPSLSEHLTYKTIIRTTATILTAYIVYLGPPPLPDGVFTRGLLYLGDISYSVYLIHWPLEVFMQYQYSDIGYRIVLLIIIFSISILQYEFLEKPLLRTSNLVVSCICVLLLALVVLQCVIPAGIQPYLPKNANSDLIEQNEKHAHCRYKVNCNFAPEIAKYFPKSKIRNHAYGCSYGGKGIRTVFVVGNSFALHQFRAVVSAFRGRFKKMYFAGRPSCVAFEHMNPLEFMCEEMGIRTHKFMKEVRPDITIIIQGIFSKMLSNKVSTPEDVKNESIVQGIKDFIQTNSKFTKKLIMVEPHGWGRVYTAQRLAQILKTGQSLDDYYMPEKVYQDSQMYSWWRLLAAMEGCQNCMTINTTDVLCHKHTHKCDLYDKDTKLSLYCDGLHFSISGVERVQPLYDEAVDKVLNELGALVH